MGTQINSHPPLWAVSNFCVTQALHAELNNGDRRPTAYAPYASPVVAYFCAAYISNTCTPTTDSYNTYRHVKYAATKNHFKRRTGQQQLRSKQSAATHYRVTMTTRQCMHLMLHESIKVSIST